jgi:hypothetical protein
MVALLSDFWFEQDAPRKRIRMRSNASTLDRFPGTPQLGYRETKEATCRRLNLKAKIRPQFLIPV